jgi:hypothetical protein
MFISVTKISQTGEDVNKCNIFLPSSCFLLFSKSSLPKNLLDPDYLGYSGIKDMYAYQQKTHE